MPVNEQNQNQLIGHLVPDNIVSRHRLRLARNAFAEHPEIIQCSGDQSRLKLTYMMFGASFTSLLGSLAVSLFFHYQFRKGNDYLTKYLPYKVLASGGVILFSVFALYKR